MCACVHACVRACVCFSAVKNWHMVLPVLFSKDMRGFGTASSECLRLSLDCVGKYGHVLWGVGDNWRCV